MNNTLFIPKRLRIGFDARADTFTGKLAYVIYYDEKGKLRKETSWESWRDKSIEPIEIDNKPTAGFVLNKGKQRCNYYHWGSGRSVIRVHHPDGFEFEISVDNLIGILMHSDVSKRDIVEECVFAWAGTELVLLPVNSEAYRESVAYTEKQDQKVSAKTLVPGRQYAQKKASEVLTYIGYHEWFVMVSSREEVRTARPSGIWGSRYGWLNTEKQVSKGKKHVFFDGKGFVVPSVSALSCEVSSDVVPHYAELVDQFFATTHSQPIVGVQVVPISAEGGLILRSFGQKALYRHDPAGGYYDRLDIRGDFIHFLHSCRPEFAKEHCKLTGMRFHVGVVDGTFTRTHSDSSSVEVRLPFDPTGNDPKAFNISDFTLLTTAHPAEIRCSDRFAAMLRDQGYGELRYILKNGNLTKG